MTTTSVPSAPTLLIVEDDDTLRGALVELFQQEGYVVAEAANGWSAFRHLVNEPAPNAIILDLLLPGMDGWSLRQEMLKDPGLADVPVIIASAVCSDLQGENRLQAHAYVPKPFDFGVLLAVVRRLAGAPAAA